MLLFCVSWCLRGEKRGDETRQGEQRGGISKVWWWFYQDTLLINRRRCQHQDEKRMHKEGVFWHGQMLWAFFE